jgi:hypothetical protein
MGALTVVREPADAAMMEQVVVVGDLTNMRPAQRVMYYNRVCESLGLNPFTKPFDYIRLNGKLVLYARKDATEQLRKKNRLSITRLETEIAEGVYIVTAYAQTGDGRTDSDIGAVNVQGLAGEAKANAMMKAITKAKRRVTLSICGLGWLDETEIDSIPDAQRVPVSVETGEIVEGQVTEQPPTHTVPPEGDKSGAPARPTDPPPDRGPAVAYFDAPTNPNALLQVVNSRVEVPYDNLPHLLQAIRNEYNSPKWNWPQMKDQDGWNQAYRWAMHHAQRKAAPATPAAPAEGDAEPETAF